MIEMIKIEKKLPPEINLHNRSVKKDSQLRCSYPRVRGKGSGGEQEIQTEKDRQRENDRIKRE